MAGLSSVGIGSGLDIGGLVEQLVAAERAPVQGRLDRKEAIAQAELSAYGVLKSNLTTLDEALKGLTDTGSGRTAASSDPDKLGATAASDAVAGRYAITVSQLAASHALASPAYSSLTEAVGTGTLTIEFGTTVHDSGADTYTSFTADPARGAQTLTIDATNNTVEGLRDAINAADMGVNAVIVNDGTGYRLLLTSEDSGAANSLRISVSDDAGSGLQDLAFNATATNMEQTVAASDALLTINGLAVTSESNDVSEAIEGVSFQLKATSEEEIQVSVDFDRSASIKAVDAFVAAYNALTEQMRELTKFNPETGQGAVLAGDGTMRSIATQLRNVLLEPVGAVGDAYRHLVNIGVKTDSGGKLTVDTAKLTEALKTDFDGVSGVLEAAATKLKEAATSFAASDGLIDARTDGLNTVMNSIGDQRIKLDDRMASIEARYLKQFTALDTLLGQLQSTSAFLTQQLANIPVPGRRNG